MKQIKHKIPRLLPSSILDRETTFLGKQQLYVYVYYSAVIVLALTANIIGVSGPQKSINLVINSVYIFVIILFFIGYLYRRITLSTALFGIIIVTQVSTMLETINCAYTPDEYHLMLIVGNMPIFTLNILFSIIAYLKYTPYILGIMSMGTYAVCMIITGNDILSNFFGIFLAIFAVSCILGYRLVQNIRSLEKKIHP